MYAKRDIYLHEELFTGYGRPQWLYTLFFFPHHLSPQTLQALHHRYQLPTHITADMVSIIQPDDIPLLQSANPPPTLNPPIPHPDTLDRPPAPGPTPTPPDWPAPNASPVPTADTTPDAPLPHPPRPHGLEFPHGTHEGVGIGPSTMPNAGQGLYGIHPLQDAPHLFARKGQFICVYATQAQQVPAKLAKTSNSRYMWSTNTHTKFNPQALYYDSSHAPHNGKYLNDLWNPIANNCELRQNSATGRVKVYAT